MNKQKEIRNKQKQQSELRNEVKKIKKKLPTYIIGFIFFAFIGLYFLEEKFYQLFGNSVNFVFSVVVMICLFSLFFILKSYFKIKKKKIAAKIIGAQLYELMKLEVDSENG
ncbi:TIGR00366 family protein [uncultured Polaribacter sp.]|uniref:TIGR00366 family protein n=1 Tax=uncultured Polaribacter sp. TaxID=174711 RepID=UPI0026345B6C|nr:TIGR00366 family protein [uncultured Polaribacter sp.]